MTAASTTDLLGNAGQLPSVKCGNMRYDVAHPTPKTLQRIEMKIAQSLFAEAEEMKGTPQYASLLEAANQAVLTRKHRVAGPIWHEVFRNELASTKLLLWACISELYPAITDEEIEQILTEDMAGVKLALACVFPFFVDLIKKRFPYVTIPAASTG